MKLYRVIVLLILLLIIPLHANARLVILPPEEMLDGATLIIVGEVTEIRKNQSENEGNVGTIKVDKILKGNIDRDTVTLKEQRYITGTLLQGIPPVGTKVFVLLKDEEGDEPYFFADCNHIGIIENDSIINIYTGINVDDYPYIDKYNKYYQTNKGNAKVPKGRIEEKQSLREDNELTSLGETIRKAIGQTRIAVAFIFIAIMISIALFIYIHRKQRK